MKYLRKWSLPNGVVIHRHEPLSHPPAWGQSFFWYCNQCRTTYCLAQLFMETDDEPVQTVPRPWIAASGRCADCANDKFTMAGSIEGIITIGWNVPLEVAHYQLEVELKFLEHPEHPFNKGEENV